MGERQGVALEGSGERAGQGVLVPPGCPPPPPPPCSESVEEAEEWRERWCGEVASRVLEGDRHKEMGEGDLMLLPCCCCCCWLCPGLPVTLRDKVEVDGEDEAERETSSGKTPPGSVPGLDEPGDPETWGSLWIMV